MEVLDTASILPNPDFRRKSSQSSIRSVTSNPESRIPISEYPLSYSPTSEESSPRSSRSASFISNINNNGYRRYHRKSNPCQLISSDRKSASDLSSMILQHQYNQQLLRIRRLTSYAGSLLKSYLSKISTFKSHFYFHFSNYLKFVSKMVGIPN